ncbi:MAG: glycosyltransferase family 39 protein [Bdellovibrionales bacterium]|nr:glycosyltransferase family 39 protein [Bdellovibrionales bacterium]
MMWRNRFWWRNTVLRIVPDYQLVAAVSLLLAGAFLLGVPKSTLRNHSADYITSYLPAAEGILAGRGPVDESGDALTHHPPGYAFMLSGMFFLGNLLKCDRLQVVRWANAVFFALSSMLLFLIVARHFSLRVAWPTVLLFVMYPINYYMLTQPNAELPFMVALFGAVLCFLECTRNSETVWPALVLGACMASVLYLRAIALFLPFLAAVGIFFSAGPASIRQRLRACALVLFATAVLLLPWQLWVYYKAGETILLSSAAGGSVADGLTLADRDLEALSLPADVRDLVEENRSIRELGSFDAPAQFLWQLRIRPLTVFKFAGLKAVYCWFLTHSGRHEQQLAVLNFFYLTLALLGLWQISKKKGKVFPTASVVTGVVLIIYFWALAFLVMPIFRYLAPVMGLLFIFVSVPILSAWHKCVPASLSVDPLL